MKALNSFKKQFIHLSSITLFFSFICFYKITESTEFNANDSHVINYFTQKRLD
jgi:hypothetical protein